MSKRRCRGTIAVVGGPSFGGQRTRGGDSTATVVGGRELGAVFIRRWGLAPCGSPHPTLELGPPNPSLKRTCLRQAA